MQNCLMVKDQICTAGSKILEGFQAPFSATVYEKCVAAGFDFAGFVPMDEFGIDRLWDADDPIDAAIIAVREGQCEAVLCNDIFGKLRRQAAQNGLIYIHPTYGTVSRYGLIPTVSSMDQVGVLCRDLKVGITMLDVISGHDPKDGTSLSSVRGTSVRGTVPLTPQCQSEPSPLTPPLAQTFLILAAAEFAGNTSRYDGITFGYRAQNASSLEEIYIRSRSEGFGREAKLLALLGCKVLSQAHYDSLYDKAMRIRRLVRDHYAAQLDKVPALEVADGAIAPLGGFAALAIQGKQLLFSGNERIMSYEV